MKKIIPFVFAILLTNSIFAQNTSAISDGKSKAKNPLINKVKVVLKNDNTILKDELKVNTVPEKSYDSLDINNINAGFNSDGFLFCFVDAMTDEPPTEFKQRFEFPNGSGLNTIFSSATWIGGLDQNDSLRLAAQRYKQIGYDFQSGPVSYDYTGDDFLNKWYRVWKLNQTDVNYHRNNYWKDSYEPKDAILSWPGNGDVENGQAEQLAPFFDMDNNGVYEPMEGDYPLIRGDQTVYFIFNDDRVHTETGGGSMKVEIHGMAYAYNKPDDNLLNNTIFIHYDIYNRSENTYYHTYFASWTDLDIGYTFDDYVGSNVVLNSFYGYNGAEIDPQYGENSPAQSVTIISGALMDSDNIDNPVDDCGYGVNGRNFGDGIVDNERYGMVLFLYHNNSIGNYGDPTIAPEYYNYLQGHWKDGTVFLPDGPACRFFFPEDTDPCDVGSGYWTEESVGNPPGDRRGLGVTGPFTFKSGDVQEIEMAFALGQGDGNTSSKDQLIENLNDLFNRVDAGEIIVPNESLSVNEVDTRDNYIKIYPNPVRNSIYLNIESEKSKNFEYSLFNSLGDLIKQGNLKTDIIEKVDVSNLNPGIYIMKIYSDDNNYQAKFIKM